MAKTGKKETQSKNIENKFEGLGTYKEATGGGEPIPKGQKRTTQKRVMQPRDEFGQFTYNAANKKELKYGPSRGTTIPPYLRTKKLRSESGKDIEDITKYTKKEERNAFRWRDPLNGGKYDLVALDDEKDFDEKEGDVRVHKGPDKKADIYNVSVKLSGYTKRQFVGDCTEYIGGKFNYQTKQADVEFTKKQGKKSYEEKAAILGDYQGNIKNLKFMGDKKALQEAWGKDKKRHPKWAATLQPREKRQIKPKAKTTTGTSFSEEDKNLLKTDPRAFQAKHSKEFGEIASMAKQAGKKINVNNLMKILSSGNISSFDEFKTLLKKKLNIK